MFASDEEGEIVNFAWGIAIGARLGFLLSSIIAMIVAFIGPRDLMVPILLLAGALFAIYVVVHFRTRKLFLDHGRKGRSG